MESTHASQPSAIPSTTPALAIPKPIPFVSIIVPVYNNAQGLQHCLVALEAQTYAPNHYEVVVVDNGSDAEEQIPSIAQQFPHTVVTQEFTLGSYAARNQGLRIARGEIIAFTDADCIPAQDWLEKGVQALLQNPSCGLVGGRINLFPKDADQPTWIELYDDVIMGFPQHEFISKRHAGATANVFTWRQVITCVGDFNAQMKSHGDMEWGKRVFSAGYEQIYADDVRVAHPARSSFDELRKRMIRLVGGMYDLHITQEPSQWKRNRRLVRLILSDILLLGSWKNIQKALRDHRLPTLFKRLQIIVLILLMRYVGLVEKLRLKLGGTAYRG